MALTSIAARAYSLLPDPRVVCSCIIDDRLRSSALADTHAISAHCSSFLTGVTAVSQQVTADDRVSDTQLEYPASTRPLLITVRNSFAVVK